MALAGRQLPRTVTALIVAAHGDPPAERIGIADRADKHLLTLAKSKHRLALDLGIIYLTSNALE